MKRVSRSSRRGGSRPGVSRQIGGGTKRCMCEKTNQILTCDNMDCPECLDRACSQLPFKVKGLQTSGVRRSFSGDRSMPVRQRNISVSPSQGGFFSLPKDERNLGQQGSLPNEQQLNFSHSNASGCGYSNMNHSNFGANTASQTWSGSQSNVGPQDRVFAGSYASGHSNMNHSNFGANTASQTWSGSQSNVGPQDRVFAGSYASGDVGRTKIIQEGRFTKTIPNYIAGKAEPSCSICEDKLNMRKFCTWANEPCSKPVSCEPCNVGAEMIENVDIRQTGANPISQDRDEGAICVHKCPDDTIQTFKGYPCPDPFPCETDSGRVKPKREQSSKPPQKRLRTRIGGGRGGSMRRTSRR